MHQRRILRRIQAARQPALAFSAAAITQVFAVVQFMFAARQLPAEQLGAWAMLLTLGSLVDMARLGGVQSALTNFLTHADEEKKPLIKLTALLMSALIGLGGGMIITVVGGLLNLVWKIPMLTQLLVWYPMAALCITPLRWQDALRTAERNFEPVFRSGLVFGALYVLLLVCKWRFVGTISALDFIQFQIVASILTPVALRRNLRADLSGSAGIFQKRENITPMLGRFWRFGRFGMGSNVFSILFQRADMLLLGAFVSPQALAGYNVATRLITWLDFPVNALSPSFASKLALAYRQGGISELHKARRKTARLLAALSLPLAGIAFIGANQLVVLTGGSQYAAAGDLLRIMLVASIAKPFGRALGMSLDAAGKPNYNFIMTGFSLLIIVGLMFIFAPLYKETGAAAAVTGGIICTTLAGQWLFHEKTQDKKVSVGRTA